MPRKIPQSPPLQDLDPTVCFRLPAEDLARLDEIAAAERRTRSQFLRNLIHDALHAARRAIK